MSKNKTTNYKNYKFTFFNDIKTNPSNIKNYLKLMKLTRKRYQNLRGMLGQKTGCLVSQFLS